MPSIYEQLTAFIAQGRPCALATLVGASGSSPQNTGAKVLVLPDGRLIGTIGGGCMEAEARRIALECLRKRTHRLFELRLDDDFGWDDGLICGGRVQIFIHPTPARSAAAYAAALETAARRERAALCTVVAGPEELVGQAELIADYGLRIADCGTAPPAPNNGGAAPPAPDNGGASTAPGGPALTASVEDRSAAAPDAAPRTKAPPLLGAGGADRKSKIENRKSAMEAAAAAVLASGRAQTVDVGGGLRVYAEPILPRPTALIAGAGHIGAALAQVLALCGFETLVVDDRPSFANAARLPFADRVVVDDIPRFVADYPLDPDSYVVIVTRGHRHDAHVLRACIHSPAKYIGMIGSKRKIVVIFEEMLREGLATKEELRRVRSPMGLTLRDREVGEIAVSIAAEIVAIRNGADLTAIRPMQYTPSFLDNAK